LCWAKSTVHPLADFSRSTANLIIFGLADVPEIYFDTDIMIKKVKYSYRTGTIPLNYANSFIE